MGTIVLHAGTPKAGSSSIQQWLYDHDADLQTAGWHLFVYGRDGRSTGVGDGGGSRVNLINSAVVVRDYVNADRDPRALDAFFSTLRNAATSWERVVLTGEGFARLFAEVDQPFLHRLEELTDDHVVRIAYYVRAQHESLEAAWCQWGFRLSLEPGQYVARRAQLLRYHHTLCEVRRLAPRVSFEPRPFRPAALTQGNVVADFADRFLGLESGDVSETAVWTNRGLPLDLVNILRHAEVSRFWQSAHHNASIRPLKMIAANWNVPESPEAERSRLVLQQFCRQWFEPSNQELIEEFGWPIEHLVPPVDDESFVSDGVNELNDLWTTSMSAAERELFYLALERVVESGGSQSRYGQRIGEIWIAELAAAEVSPSPPPYLLCRSDGRVFLIEGGRKRIVRSGLLVAIFEREFAPAEQTDDAELGRLPDGTPVELFEGHDGSYFVVYGGEAHPVRGIPKPQRLSRSGTLTLPQGSVIQAVAAKAPDADDQPQVGRLTRLAKRWSRRRR